MTYKTIINILKKYDNFLISSHISPDPDALSSELAVAEYLKKLGKKVQIINHECVPDRYEFLPGVGTIKGLTDKMKPQFQAAVIVDCGDLARIGNVRRLINDETVIINIDHHVTNDKFGHVNCVEPNASSTAEVLFNIFTSAKFSLTKSLAANLYAGLMTDTGCFCYDNTTAKVHSIASKLREYDFPAYDMYRRSYEAIPLKDMKAFTQLISQFKTFLDNRVVYIEIKKNILKKFSDDFDLRDSILKFIRSIEGVEVFVIISEVSSNVIRVNFRSSDKVNVSKIAADLGGGGHRKASGCVLNGTFDAAKKKVFQAIKKELKVK